MQRILTTLSILLIASFTFHAEAQIERYLKKKLNQAGKRAQEKADERVTEEMNEAVDKQVDKAFDAALEGENNENDSTAAAAQAGSYDDRSAAMLKAMGISMDAGNVKDAYSFSGDIEMEVQTWDGQGNTDGAVRYTTYMNEDHSGFALDFYQDEQRSTIIFDYLEGSMIILSESEGQKTGMVTHYQPVMDSINKYNQAEEKEIQDYSVYNENLKKTGRSKTIAGFRCDEYYYEDEELESTLWMTDELPAELWTNMLSSNYVAAANTGYYGGFVMEMVQTDKEDQSKTTMQVLDVNEKNPSSISTKGYQIMSLGAVPTDEE